MRKTGYTLYTWLVITLLGVVLTGCGGTSTPSGNQPDATSSSAEASTTATQTGTYNGEQITLKMADSVPVSHIAARVSAKVFIDRVSELTNGKVKVEYYPAEQLGKQKDMLDLNSKGVADIVDLGVSFLAGQLPLTTVMILPELDNAAVGAAVFKQVLDIGAVADEFSRYGIRPLWGNTTPPYNVVTRDEQVTRPADLAGMKLKTSGGFYNVIAEAYGISPVTVPSPETYEAIQRGVVEGVLFSYPAVDSYKLTDVVKYITYGANFGSYANVFTINEKKWQGLPDEVKDAIAVAADDAAVASAQAWDEEEARLLVEFEKGGMEVYRIATEKQGEWAQPAEGLSKVWIESMKEKGLPGAEVYKVFEEALQKAR
ncbi:MAG: TRAP transporter substrate-binding protein [Thermoleophilia bacterium]